MKKAFNVTGTGLIGAAKAKELIGFYVNSTTAGTLVLRDGGATGRVLSGTITPAVGFHPFPAGITTDLHVTVGGTIDVSFFVEE